MESKRIKLTVYTSDLESIEVIKLVAHCGTSEAIRMALRICCQMIQGAKVDGGVEADISEMFQEYTDWQPTADGDLSKLTKHKRHEKTKTIQEDDQL